MELRSATLGFGSRKNLLRSSYSLVREYVSVTIRIGMAGIKSKTTHEMYNVTLRWNAVNSWRPILFVMPQPCCKLYLLTGSSLAARGLLPAADEYQAPNHETR